MTTLSMPSLEGRLLQTVEEQLATERIRDWPPWRLRLCLNVVRELRASTIEARQALEEELAEGVEARSFTNRHGRALPSVEEHVGINQRLVESLLDSQDRGAENLVAELRLLEQEKIVLRDLLAEALSLASGPPRPVDWGRIHAAEEACERGELKPFSRR